MANPANQPRNFVEPERAGRPLPLTCRQCDEPQCAAVCITGALAIKRAAGGAVRAVVPGGGLVGIEAVESLARNGLRITVIEIAEHILPLQLDWKAARVTRNFKRSKD